jgi:heme-degrading monooxygenase HmoA
MEPSPRVDERDDSAVTVSITNRVRPGLEEEFEGWLRGIDDAASHFPGYLGTRVFRPVRGDRQYRVVLRFKRERDLRRWIKSDERRDWYARREPHRRHTLGREYHWNSAGAAARPGPDPSGALRPDQRLGHHTLVARHCPGDHAGQLAPFGDLRALVGDRGDRRGGGLPDHRVPPALGQRWAHGAILLYCRLGDQARGARRRTALPAPGRVPHCRGAGRRHSACPDLRSAQPGECRGARLGDPNGYGYRVLARDTEPVGA